VRVGIVVGVDRLRRAGVRLGHPDLLVLRPVLGNQPRVTLGEGLRCRCALATRPRLIYCGMYCGDR
jgi:hypothetical protein